MSRYDLAKKFQEDVNELMTVVNQILEAQERSEDIMRFMPELNICYKKVQETQLQREDFYNTLREVLGYGKESDSNFC